MNFIKKPRPVDSAASATAAAAADDDSQQASAAASQQGNFLNLILFGETGVGKSSMINTFANLLSYGSFDQANQEEPRCVIPCSFNMTDDNNNSTTVYMGDQTDAAKLAPGGSVTQAAKSHFFDVEVNGSQRKLHIIDTPGVGDTRGFEQDKENIKNVIEYIKNFDGLNTICILLLPNSSRFTLQFRYCFKELLVNLSRGTVPNICFCYTNSRGTFFRPGECHPMLVAELEKIEREDKVKIPRQSNFFCFDSEIFRYLGAKKHGIKFVEDEVDSYKKSWEKNNTSLAGLISHAANLPMASVKPIYLLSTARRCLMELSKPVAELSRNIQTNKKLAEDKRAELLNLSAESNLQAGSLYINQVDLEMIPLSMPKTVCSDSQCAPLVTFNGVQKVNYSSDCHSPCYLDGVDSDVVAHPAIKDCHAFDQGKSDECLHCGHHWQQHLHVTNDFREILVQIIDPNVQSLIDQNAAKADILAAGIESTEALIRDFETEQELLIRSSAKLAKYIKKNGIIYYNPDLEEYLNLLIREEEQKKAAGGNNTAVIDGLRQVKSDFLAEVDILSSSLKAGGDEIATEADIHDLMEKLSQMKMTGNALATMLHTSAPKEQQQQQ